MRRVLAAAAITAIVALALFIVVTGYALEAQEVAILRVVTADDTHDTRLWIAEWEGALLVESATPERRWYLALAEQPIVEVTREGALSPSLYRATPMPGPEGHELIRRLLRERYGWADAYVGLLQDTSRSVAVRLEPYEPEAAP